MTEMLQPEFKDTDEVLEYAARLIEDTDISDLRGVWAKRKRDREDAELRLNTAAHVRKRCAEHVRAMKVRRNLDATAVLQRIDELPADDLYPHTMMLRNAWQLALDGFVDIECIINCAGNSVPAETRYRITLTEAGRKKLRTAHSEDVKP